MHGFISHLTAVLLLAHTVVGCCWHHVHACGHEHGPLALVGFQHGSDQHYGCTGGASEQSRDTHSGGDDCRGSKCNFVVAKDSAVRVSGPACELAVLPGLADDCDSACGLLHPALFRTGGLLLPVRLHLANQVLLI